MIVIPFVIILTALAYFRGSFIRKHNVKLYLALTLIAVFTFITRYRIPITEPFTQGYLGLSFLYLVMITGALNSRFKISKKLLGVRKEYSIIGFVLVSPHGLKYLLEFLKGDIKFEWFGILPYVIMIPLFITSFMVIRKKMSPVFWKNLQKNAYIVYLLIFVHLILVAELPNLAVYIVLFVPYITLKIVKEYKIILNN